MHFRKAERTRFATAFAEQFFHRKKTARTACHLFIEEAQAYLPQMVRGDEARMVGVFEDLGKVGRNYGIGNTLISQRPQAINKDVLNQVEVLLAFQTNGPQERKAIAGWTAENTDAGAAMIQELPKLHVGEALIWSPQWLRVAQKVHIEKRDTYDASSTPTQQAKSIKPKTLAKADLEQLGEEIKATIEKAKADDPRELRKQIADLKKQVTSGFSTSNERTKPEVKTIERFVLKDGQLARAEKILERVDQVADKFSTFEEDLRVTAKEIRDAIAQTRQPIHPTTPNAAPRSPQTRRVDRALPPSTRSTPARLVSDGSMTPALRGPLLVLANNQEDGCGIGKLALLSGKRISGGFRNILAALRTNGWMEGSNTGVMRITPAGLEALGSYDPLPSGAELGEYWLSNGMLTPAAREILRALLAHRAGYAIDALAERVDKQVSGGFRNLLAELRTAGVIVGRNTEVMRASEELFS
jgi:hypothetical protein